MRFSLRSLKVPLFLYILKCLIGLSIGYALYIRFPQHQFFWTLISVILVTAPDPKDSVRLAMDRMAANVIGSVIGIALFFINGPGLLMMAIGVVVTILLCSVLKLAGAIRTALAAMLIVMLYETNTHSWKVAVERMGCVIIGCIIALAVSVFFRYLIRE